MRNISIIILSILLFASCEKNANIEIPNDEPELVVAGFIAPHEDTLRLKLSWTTPIYNHTIDYSGEYYNNEANADVNYTVNGNTIKLNYDTLWKCYMAINANLNTGDEVELSIKYNDHEEMTSKATVPFDPEYSIEYIGMKKLSHGDYEETYAQFDFKCLASKPLNYYRIKMMAHYTENGYVYNRELYMYENEYIAMGPNTSVILSPYFPEYVQLDSVRYYVINCSEEYYKYHTSVGDYQGDDLFSEPSIIYDNIENGIGVFSGYNMESDTLIIN